MTDTRLRNRLSGLWQGSAALWQSGVERRHPDIAFQSGVLRAVSELRQCESGSRELLARWRYAVEAAADFRKDLEQASLQLEQCPLDSTDRRVLENRRGYLEVRLISALTAKRAAVAEAGTLEARVSALVGQYRLLQQQRSQAGKWIPDEKILNALDAKLDMLAQAERMRNELASVITDNDRDHSEGLAGSDEVAECADFDVALSDGEMTLATRAMLFMARVDGPHPQQIDLIRRFFETGVETDGLPLFDDVLAGVGRVPAMDAARFCAVASRELILKLCVLTAYADGDCSPAECRTLKALATDLDIRPERLAELHDDVKHALLDRLSGLPDTLSVAAVARELGCPS
ncbi:hypothetical protein EV700_1458 [Fluviicoccus keumensis]|uniref:Tellurite resistance protein TerB n=1 Tax=Fluviicoccus keumensis TaxID=1435465 RepID=A0A4Q7Z955_9GAMM|nr:hypothetical protein [Fluviicoccus keumensis]RZU47067.1 hypothetical protein EV700_1458 [Fluviicoccus keumensis]